MQLARVAQVLGQTDTSMTYRAYLHLFPDDFSANIERLEADIAPVQRLTEDAPVALRRAED